MSDKVVRVDKDLFSKAKTAVHDYLRFPPKDDKALTEYFFNLGLRVLQTRIKESIPEEEKSILDIDL